MWIGEKPWQSKTSSSKMDTTLSMLKTEARTEITKNCNNFWTLFNDWEKLAYCVLLLKKVPYLLPCWGPLLLLCASTSLPVAKWCWVSFQCVSLIQFAVWLVAKRVGLLSLQLPLVLAWSFCENVPWALLVHEITVWSFKLQVAVTSYCHRNYPQHFPSKTLVFNSVKLAFWVNKYTSCWGVLCVLRLNQNDVKEKCFAYRKLQVQGE